MDWEEGLETRYLSSPRPGATLDISAIRQAWQLCPGLLRPGSGPNYYCSPEAPSLSPKALKGVTTINIPFPKVGKLSPRDGQQKILSNRQPGHRSPGLDLSQQGGSAEWLSSGGSKHCEGSVYLKPGLQGAPGRGRGRGLKGWEVVFLLIG